MILYKETEDRNQVLEEMWLKTNIFAKKVFPFPIFYSLIYFFFKMSRQLKHLILHTMDIFLLGHWQQAQCIEK